MHASTRDAQANFVRLVQRVAKAEKIVVVEPRKVESGKPIAPKLGTAAGDFVAPADFDDPLLPLLLAEFES